MHPKDSYHLPTIDQLIDATHGHLMLIFVYAYTVIMCNDTTVVLAIEIGSPSFHIVHSNKQKNSEGLRTNPNLSYESKSS